MINNHCQLIPRIIINYKTYLEVVGDGALALALKANAVSQITKVPIGVVPQYTDLFKIANSVKIPVFAQHVDPISPGSHTGYILPDAILATGAVGTLINHSERQLKLSDIAASIQMAKVKQLISVVCASNPAISIALAALKPDVLAIEPPELIGTGISVSKAKPEIITETIHGVRKINASVKIFCGAGVSTGDDVLAAIKLGAEGVLVASSIVKAKDQHALLGEFAQAFK